MTFPSKDSLSTYGGELVDLYPPTDATTDRSADAANQAYASTAAMTKTALQCWARFTTHATTPFLAVSGVAHDSAWGSDVSVAPAVARTGTGVWTLTWPVTVTDELGDTQTVNLRAAVSPCAEGSTAVHAQAQRTSANVITVRTFDMAGSAADVAATTLWVGAI